MKTNIIDILFPAVSLDVVVANATAILSDKEPVLVALKTDKSVIVNSQSEAFEIAEKAVLAGIVVTSIETLLQDGYTTIGDVAVDVSLPAQLERCLLLKQTLLYLNQLIMH